MARRLPLDGVRIVAIEQFGAGPFGTSHLVSLGAEVIKIEAPGTGGDVGRDVPPDAADGDSLFFQTFNAGKRSMFLDISSGEGRALLERLLQTSDALFYNLRGDVADSLRLRYADLEGVNPRLVVCSLSGFGMTGPRRAEPGYDYILQAMAGWMHITGEPDGPPVKSGLSVVDFSAGYAAALALVTGLFDAARTGRGTECDVSLFDTAINMLTYEGAWTLNSDYQAHRTPHSAHRSIVPFQAFQASDGWFTVAAPKEKFWRRLAVAIDRAELLDDPRFATMASRRANAAELVPILEARLRERSVSEWVEDLRTAGVPVGPVNDLRAALQDPQVAARGLVETRAHARRGSVRTLASPVRVGDARADTGAAPYPDADTDAVLAELGVAPDEIYRLRLGGIVGMTGV